MKKLFFLTVFLCSISLYSQSLGYNDIGVLFTDDYNYGTARYRAMGGAFGALGGDMSATAINPAGAAVFLKSEFSATFNFRETTVLSTYYGENSLAKTDYNNFSQVGGVFVFGNGGSNWSKTAIGFNYSMANDFNSRWIAKGNSNIPTFKYDDDGNEYLFSNGQYFDNYTTGKNDKYTFSFASQYSDKLYIGAAFTTNDVRFYQSVYLEEDNHDNMGNSLLGSLEQELTTYGTGYSFNIGIISKPVDNIRFGLAYQSPIWYDLLEEFYDSEEGNGINGFRYSMRSPSKFTGSMALVFNQFGLISADYVYRDYSNITLSPSFDFDEENRNFETDYKSTSELRLGTEWRFKRLSLRGGAYYQQSPIVDAPDGSEFYGYSAGIGLNLGAVKFDISYEESRQSSTYNFYPQPAYSIEPAYLQKDNSIVTATIILSM